MIYSTITQAITMNKVGDRITKNLTKVGTTDLVLTTANSYNQTYGITNTTRINSNGVGESGVELNFNNLEIGDFIEVELEVRTLSGVSPKIIISEYNPTTKVHDSKTTKKIDNSIEWRIEKTKVVVFVNKTFYNHRVFIGLETGETGVFDIRSVRAIAFTKTQQSQDKIDRGYYSFKIDKTNGVWSIDTAVSTTGGGLTLLQNYNLTLSFPAKYRPRIFINSTFGSTYRVSTNNPSSSAVTVGCSRLSDNNVSWNEVPDGSSVFLNVYYNPDL